MNESEVKLIATSKGVEHEALGPEELTAYGAYGCFEQGTSYEVFKNHFKDNSEEEFREEVKEVLKQSAGRGHGAVADQNLFVFSIKNLSRAATLHLCLPEYLMHLQQSMRRATAERGYVLPEQIKESSFHEEVKETLDQAFETYKELLEEEIPIEDARFLLPLYTRTNIQTAGNARELMHLYHMTKEEPVPTPVKKIVDEMVEKARKKAPGIFKDWGHNYERLAWFPSAQLYTEENGTFNEILEENNYPGEAEYIEKEMSEEAIDKAIKERDEAELSNLKHIHNGNKIQGFLAPMSIACYHQSTRQRTWNHSIESIYDAAERGNIVIPPTVKESPHTDKFKEQHRQMIKLYKKLVNNGIPKEEAIGVIPHSVEMYDLIHVNGWNSIHSIGKRTCTKAQWEIRRIANKVAAEIRKRNPVLGKYTYPQGVIYGECPEADPCGLCDKIIEKRKE